MARRHKSKKSFSFPGAVMSLADKAILDKPLKEYKEELLRAKVLLADKGKLRRRGKIDTIVENCKLPSEGVLLGGLRFDRVLKKTRKI